MGKHFGFGDAHNAGDFEIVRITEDAKYQDAREPAYPTFFPPFLQIAKDPKLTFMMGSHYIRDIELRVAGRPPDLEANVRRTLAEIDSNLNVFEVVTLSEQLARNFNQLIARLSELFGLLALILACVGLYGVTAYSVARRSSEIGIRVALGANRGNVLGLVLRGALFQLALGLALGIPLALVLGRLLASQLYRVKSSDPLILALAALVLAACALFAGFVPARPAASIDPLRALGTE